MKELLSKVEKKEKEVRELKLKVTDLEGKIKGLRQDKLNLATNGVHGDERKQRTLLIDHEIEDLEKQKKDIDVELAKKNLAMKEDLKEDVVKVKKERSEKVKEANERVQEINEEVFKAKLEMMEKLVKAEQERSQLVEDIKDISNVIGKVESKDREPSVKQLDYTPNRYGQDTISVTPTTDEINSIFGIGGKLSSPIRLYLQNGEVERNVLEADKKLRESKGGKK